MAVAAHKMASSKEFAAAIHKTPRYVQKLVQSGKLTNRGTDSKYEFYWTEAVWEYLCIYDNEQNEKTETEKQVDARKAKADADYKAAKAAQEELELAELEGNMHRSEDVEAAFEAFAYNVRSEVSALPGRLAIDVASAETPAEVASVIQAQVDAVLESLSEFAYDPDFFAERVRERKGWSDADATDDGATD